MRLLICLGILMVSSAVTPALGAALAATPEEVHPLRVGSPAPTAPLKSVDGKDVDLSALLAGKPTVLIFYRGGWCPFCNRHLAALGQAEVDLRRLGCQIIGISPDRMEAMAETVAKHRLLYRLYSDRKMDAALAYGVAYRITAETAKAYKENGIELAPAPGTTDFWLPVPTAFVIDRNGIVRFVYSNPDPSVRVSPGDLLAAVKAATEK